MLNEFDPESWEQLPPAADEIRGDEMSHRLEALCEAQQLDKLKSLSSDCEKQQRRICVQLEIDADVNSPREEQSLRMELQLQQLASGFGKRGPDLKQTAQKAREAEIGLLCAGPLAPGCPRGIAAAPWAPVAANQLPAASLPYRLITGFA